VRSRPSPDVPVISNPSPDEGLHQGLSVGIRVCTDQSLPALVPVSQAHQQTSISWSKSPASTSSPSCLQAMDTAAGLCPARPPARAHYAALPVEPPKISHILGTTKPTRDAGRKVPDPSNPQESPGQVSPAASSSRPQRSSVCSSPRLPQNAKADFTPAKRSPEEKRSRSLSKPTSCRCLLAQQRLAERGNGMEAAT